MVLNGGNGEVGFVQKEGYYIIILVEIVVEKLSDFEGGNLFKVVDVVFKEIVYWVGEGNNVVFYCGIYMN